MLLDGTTGLVARDSNNILLRRVQGLVPLSRSRLLRYSYLYTTMFRSGLPGIVIYKVTPFNGGLLLRQRSTEGFLLGQRS